MYINTNSYALILLANKRALICNNLEARLSPTKIVKSMNTVQNMVFVYYKNSQ